MKILHVYLFSHERMSLLPFPVDISFLLLISVARTCSLIYIVLDVLKPLQHKKLIEKELEGFGIRLNAQPPNIGFKRKDKGGINFTATVSRIIPKSILSIVLPNPFLYERNKFLKKANNRITSAFMMLETLNLQYFCMLMKCSRAVNEWRIGPPMGQVWECLIIFYLVDSQFLPFSLAHTPVLS